MTLSKYRFIEQCKVISSDSSVCVAFRLSSRLVWGPDGGLVASYSNIYSPAFSFLCVSVLMTRYRQRYLMRIPARGLGIVPEKVSEQLYFHAFTGCETISAFRRKGK